MNEKEIIDKSIAFVKTQLKDAEGGHDWFHIERVYKNAMHLAKMTPEADRFIIALGALFHDIADAKFHNGDENIGPETTRNFLSALHVSERTISHVENIIRHISFKGGNEKQEFHSLELNIVQDADRLDAIGAIGIARTFNYGGFKNRSLYDPDIPPQLNMTKDAYRKSTSPTINHFYEKLLLLKDRMNTEAGKALAEKRHLFMEQFLEQFYKEWEGN